MAVDVTTAESLGKKLQEFGGTLPPPEQEALFGLLKTFSNAVKGAISGASLLETEEETLRAVRSGLQQGEQAQAEITPTVTTVTITTTAASHRWITCS